MSTCISREGEYSEHQPDADFCCTRCFALDETALRARLAEAEALLREGIEAFRFTREYVEPAVLLPAIEGWSWFDWCQSARAALGEARP